MTRIVSFLRIVDSRSNILPSQDSFGNSEPALLNFDFALRGTLGDLVEPVLRRPAGWAGPVLRQVRPRLRTLREDVPAVLY